MGFLVKTLIHLDETHFKCSGNKICRAFLDELVGFQLEKMTFIMFQTGSIFNITMFNQHSFKIELLQHRVAM